MESGWQKIEFGFYDNKRAETMIPALTVTVLAVVVVQLNGRKKQKR